ncbi:hypothetical protein BC835DRAFT_120290 [Cytidiella melzeri]|nr:hypothetical protein BC835DRAFT_120290 [Cytidiella melzeri]
MWQYCVAIDDFTRLHPFRCGVPLVAQFAVRAPGLYMFIISLPIMVFALLLTIIGFGVAGVRAGSLAAGFQAATYTSGAGGIPARSTFAMLQSSGACMGSGILVMPHPLDVFLFFLQLVLAVWGTYILWRQLFG